MLSAHSNIAIIRRTYLWSKYYSKFGNLDQDENFNRCLHTIMNSKTIIDLNLDEDIIRDAFSQGDATYPRLFEIILMQFAATQGKSRWGEQMGMIEQYADLIFSAYPEAKMIHMIRDPRNRFIEKFAEQNSRPGKVGWETERWLNSIWLANRNMLRYPGNYFIVRYESYAANPEDIIRKVCEFVGESYEEHMLTMDSTIRFGNKPHQFNELSMKNKVENINTRNNNSDILSRRDLVYLQSSTINELLRHDYAIEDVRLSILERILYIFYDWPINYLGAMAYKISSSTPWSN